MKDLRVAKSSKPTSVAGAIVAAIKADGEVSVRAISPVAVNQAVKAIAIANRLLGIPGKELYCKPELDHVEFDEKSVPLMYFKVVLTDI